MCECLGMRLRVIPKLALCSPRSTWSQEKSRSCINAHHCAVSQGFTFWAGMSNAPSDDTFDFQSDGEAFSPLCRSTPSSSETTDGGQQSQVSQVRLKDSITGLLLHVHVANSCMHEDVKYSGSLLQWSIVKHYGTAKCFLYSEPVMCNMKCVIF